MKKSLYSMSIATLLAITSIPAKALDDGLVYVAVDPCRIVDTRNAGGAISADTSRNFLVSGTSAQLSAQGGTADCLNPRAGSKPLAISAYVLAVPPVSGSDAGVLTAFPAGDPDPAVGAGSTVNFAAGQVIGNTTTITLCDPTGTCPTDGEFAILSRLTNQEVVVDVQGYYYPAAGSCSDDMVAVGNVCVDKYEASLVDDSGAPTTAAACLPDGSDCGGAIFAVSVDQVNPAGDITWYQAAQACANVGKRLPTTVEWQAAAAGTVDPGLNADLNVGCNTDSGAVSQTGQAQNCQSTAGAFDMIGNMYEYAAELDIDGTNSGSSADKFTTTDSATVTARAFGADYNTTGTGKTNTGTNAVLTLNTTGFADGALTTSSSLGFRCVR